MARSAAFFPALAGHLAPGAIALTAGGRAQNCKAAALSGTAKSRQVASSAAHRASTVSSAHGFLGRAIVVVRTTREWARIVAPAQHHRHAARRAQGLQRAVEQGVAPRDGMTSGSDRSGARRQGSITLLPLDHALIAQGPQRAEGTVRRSAIDRRDVEMACAAAARCTWRRPGSRSARR